MVDGISIVVPTFNRAAKLEVLLDALLEGAAADAEVVVVDDGSTDRTPEVIGAMGTRVRGVRQENRGRGAARHAGWRASSRPVVVFTDDDAVPAEGWPEELVRALDEQGVDAVGGPVLMQARTFLGEFARIERLMSHGVDRDGSVRYLVTANLAVRRDALERVGGFDVSLREGEDTDLSARLLAVGCRLGVTDRAPVYHDPDIRLRHLLERYHRAGRARRQLSRRHDGFGAAAGVGRVGSVRALHATYRRYRAHGAGRGRAAAYLGLRVLGLVVFAVGMARGA